MFIGDKQVLDKLDARWKDAASEYENAGKRARTVADALQVRDELWAAFPDLVRWRLAQPGDDKRVEQDVDQLVNGTRELAAKLEPAAKYDGRLAARTADLQKRLEIQEDVKEQGEHLVDSRGGNADDMQRIARLLEFPFITGRHRASLRSKYLEIMDAQTKAIKEKEEEQDGTGEKAGKDASAKSNQLATERLHRLRLWKTHPVLQILGIEANDDEKIDPKSSDDEALIAKLNKQGGEVRKRLLQVGREAPTLLSRKDEEPSAGPETAGGDARTLDVVQRRSEIPARRSLSRADCLVRAAAPLLEYRWESPDASPSRQLRKFDLHHLWLWQAVRAADDFWWSANERNEKSGKKTLPYFEIAAGTYLKHAKSCRDNATWASADRPYWQKVEDLVENRRKAARQAGIEPAKPGLPDDVDEKDPSLRITLLGKRTEGLPQGKAAVYVVEDRTNEKQLEPLAISEGGEPDLRRIGIKTREKDAASSQWTKECWIRNNDRFKQHPRFDVVSLFRGHRQTMPFSVSTAKGVAIKCEAEHYPQPTITVCGDAKEKCAIMFVLDCSASMADAAETEAGGKAVSRFQIARQTLKSILRRLATGADAGRYRVGLALYGHRFGWIVEKREDGTEKLRLAVWNPAVSTKVIDRDTVEKGMIPISDKEAPDRQETSDALDRLQIEGVLSKTRVQDLEKVDDPCSDTEVVFQPTPFGNSLCERMCEKLDEMPCLGQTPLYRSIEQSIQVLSRNTAADEIAHRHVIVITDGQDDERGSEKVPVTRGDVKRAVEGRSSGGKNTDLDVIGFCLDKKR